MKFLILLKKFCHLLISNKIKFSTKNLMNKELILIDDNTIEYLKEPILNNFDYFFISSRPLENVGHYYINFKILIHFLKGYFSKKLNLKNSYLYSLLKISKPKAVLENTFDHNLIFLAKEFQDIKFFIILQGTWFYILKEGKDFVKTAFHYELSKSRTGNLNNFNILIWGQKDQDIFEDVGINKLEKNVNFLKVGSYEASYYRNKYSLKINKEKNSIIFISQIHPVFFSINHKFQKLILRDSITAINLILNFAIKNNLEFRYICRGKNNRNIDEINFLKSKIYNFNEIKVIENKTHTLWKEIFSSKLVTSLYSTGAHDSIILKKKTILLPLSHKKIYKWSSNKFRDDVSFWPWTIEDDDQNRFDELCKKLMDLSQTSYEEKINKIHSYWFDKRYNESHNVIKNIIRNEIK